jgi:glycosyltransferase involved in cell wall biosynthesis
MGLHEFVFLHMGAMTWNKGVDALLKAFAIVVSRMPNCCLMLKGRDDLYRSNHFLQQAFTGLSEQQRKLVLERMLYTGKSVSMQRMAEIYNAADAYVSPYRAEGFNLPVLEAMACGLPTICTGGGATDDFIDPAAVRTINAPIMPIPASDGSRGWALEPDVEHLAELMCQAMSDSAWRSAAGLAGPRHVAERYSWDHVTDELVTLMSPGAA